MNINVFVFFHLVDDFRCHGDEFFKGRSLVAIFLDGEHFYPVPFDDQDGSWFHLGTAAAAGTAAPVFGLAVDAAGPEAGSLTLAIKENRCEASKMAYFFVKFFIFFLSNV